MPFRHDPCALPLQALCPSPRTFCPAPTGLRADVGKGRACPSRLQRRRTPPFSQGILPCPTPSDRRRSSASQHRRPRRARWSFPSYSPESPSRHSTIGSRNSRQISFPVLLEGCCVARQGCFDAPVLPGGCFVARPADFSDIVFTSLFQVSF